MELLTIDGLLLCHSTEMLLLRRTVEAVTVQRNVNDGRKCEESGSGKRVTEGKKTCMRNVGNQEKGREGKGRDARSMVVSAEHTAGAIYHPEM